MKRFMMMIMAVALMALPTMGQQQEWKSTSTLPGAGSSYTPQINAVGATTVSEMATTTQTYSPANSGPRKMKMGDFEDSAEGGEGDEGSPIGDAVLPLMLCAAVFCGVIALRRRRRAVEG